jgi:transketolase
MADINLDELCINTLRFLAVDAVEKAKSGHPGTPLGASPLAYVLWDRFLKHYPLETDWFNRDRFILSAGHASMLLYSLLYLTGYELSLEDIKQFRKWGSKTPGHPEYHLTPGVEVTSGPLGQGFANGVGLAIAERWLAKRYNRPGFKLVDHYTYALVSDGDLQEGVASEAASLAGNLKLGKIIYLYDSNGIQQDGPTVSFTEDVSRRFEAYNWNVIGPIDGMNTDAVARAIHKAQSQEIRPNLIICKTVIGYGSPHKAGSNAAHGEPLGDEEVRLTKKKLKWEYQDQFQVPPQALKHFRRALERGKNIYGKWQSMFAEYRKAYPSEASQLENEITGKLPRGWDAGLTELILKNSKIMSTRDASGKVLNNVCDRVPALLGGAADVAGSIRAYLSGYPEFSSLNYNGRNIRFGLREHAMGAVSNGMALHGGIIPFNGSFLIFSDYMRPPIRLAAIMKLRIIYLFSHDSIGLGEDGPTHQPVENIMGLRMIPGLTLIRPADATETIEAWKIALRRRTGPTVLVLSRQSIPVLDRSEFATADGVERGGYILWQSGKSPQMIIIGTGSEVHIALEAGRLLEKRGIVVRVVSLPSWDIFDSQPVEYQQQVLPPRIKTRISIEAGTTLGWERYVGLEGRAIGISHFGVSAPGEVLYKKYGLTPQRVAATALELLS